MLPHYASYAEAVSHVRSAAASLSAFSTAVKEDKRLTESRNKARAELQGLYDLVRTPFDMPIIPVYLPVRKKIMVRGQAHALGGMPQEIRVYPIHGPAAKEYAYWQPRDILIDPAECVLETVIHECAHILEAHRHGVMGHEQAFVSAYCDIEASLIEAGACRGTGPAYRFSGCPVGSYGAMQFGRRRVCTPPHALHITRPPKPGLACEVGRPAAESFLVDEVNKFGCPSCGAPLEALRSQVGTSGKCPMCQKTIVAPEPGKARSANPASIEARVIGSKTIQWDCPKCALPNNARLSSFGTLTSCKRCKLSFVLKWP